MEKFKTTLCSGLKLPALTLLSLSLHSLTATKQPHQSGLISLVMYLIPDKLLDSYVKQCYL